MTSLDGLQIQEAEFFKFMEVTVESRAKSGLEYNLTQKLNISQRRLNFNDSINRPSSMNLETRGSSKH